MKKKTVICYFSWNRISVGLKSPSDLSFINVTSLHLRLQLSSCIFVKDEGDELSGFGNIIILICKTTFFTKFKLRGICKTANTS
jgi:hypothetical protein